MSNKNIFIIFYWFFAYTILLAFLITSFIKALSKYKSDIFHFLMILSCSLLMIGTTLIIIIGTENDLLVTILQILSISGVCLGIYAIPAFAFSLSPNDGKNEDNMDKKSKTDKYEKILKILGIISLLFFILSIYNFLTRKALFLFFIVYIFYFLIIAITSASGIISIGKGNKEENKDNFWSSYLKKLGVISIIFVPIFILIDLFGGFGFKPISKIYNLGFRFFPLFFVLWSFLYFIQIAKSKDIQLVNNQDKNVININNLSTFNLSPREKEVLELLLSGFSYKQIASKLNISMATAKTHIARIYEKTGCGSKIELMNKILKKEGNNGKN